MYGMGFLPSADLSLTTDVHTFNHVQATEEAGGHIYPLRQPLFGFGPDMAAADLSFQHVLEDDLMGTLMAKQVRRFDSGHHLDQTSAQHQG
jgi:hypothetical protein